MAKHKKIRDKNIIRCMVARHRKLVFEAHMAHVRQERPNGDENAKMKQMEQSHTILVRDAEMPEEEILQIEQQAYEEAIHRGNRRRMFGNIAAAVVIVAVVLYLFFA